MASTPRRMPAPAMWPRHLVRELACAARSLARTPLFTGVCVLMLGVGIGLCAYMFGVIQTFVLEPLPYPQAERLVFVGLEDPLDPGDDEELLSVELHEFDAAAAGLEQLAGFYEGTVNLGDPASGVPERFDGLFVSPGLFALLGASAAQGRVLASDDARPGAPPVAVIADAMWQNRFMGDPAVVGRSVLINGRATTIVGVMPPAFRFPMLQQAWLPMVVDPAAPRSESMEVTAIGRLAPGSDPATVRQALNAQLARINAAHPGTRRSDAMLVAPWADWQLGADVRRVFDAMFVAVLLVLLIACANVAHLLLARGLSRSRDLAVRGALGASRARLVGQVLAESAMVALAAALLGLVLASLGGEATVRALMASGEVPLYWARFTMDATTVAFTLLVSLAAAVLAGLWPALRTSRLAAAQGMRDGGGGAVGGRSGSGRVLAVLQVALCMVLLSGAGLTIRSVRALETSELGVPTAGVLTARVGLFEAGYPDAGAQRAFIDELERRLRALPQVEAAAVSTALPASSGGDEAWYLPGAAGVDATAAPQAWVRRVSPGWLDVFPRPLLAGRWIASRDAAQTRPVAVVSRSLAERAWPGDTAIGKRLHLGAPSPDAPALEVVGVVEDAVDGSLHSRNLASVFLPIAQQPARFFSIAVATSAPDPQALTGPLRDVVAAIDPGLPLYWTRSMDRWLQGQWWDERLMAQMFSVFGLFALLLAGSGIYAVLAYAVGQRRREIGVRRALGADDRRILRMVLGQGLRQLLLGLGIGLVLALAFARLLASVLFEVEPFDPPTFLLACGVLLLSALAAALLPSRRALQVAPMQALRHD